MSYPHDLNDDHNDPCFMCERIYRKHDCKGCQYKTCPKCGEVEEECSCHEYEQEDVFETLAGILKPITPII